jgi:hypothetical protein
VLADALRPARDGLPSSARRLLRLLKVDLEPRPGQPSWTRFAIALVLANAASLASDAVLVAVATAIFPSLRGFQHFQPLDYGKLTVVGVTIACIAWPIMTRISSEPRWLFLRLAVLVILVLWLPDLWILLHGEPVRGVIFLALMHLAIAFIAYNALVRIAPAGPRPATAEDPRVSPSP